MIARTSPDRITFAVNPVERATKPLPTHKPQESLRGLIGTGVEACSSDSAACIRSVGFHPLIAAAYVAFNDHRPLVLSPDMIWVTILQGAARHVINHAERLRPRFVGHQGKLLIQVEQAGMHPGSPENAWNEVIEQLSAWVREHVGATYNDLNADFSTTGPAERLAAEVALLDMFRPYFEYRMVGICGIPKVTLEGTPFDWHYLRAKVDHLDLFDLDWWLPGVRAVCDQFARAADGDVDPGHWRDLIKREKAYGGDIINGWLVHLIPYLKNGQTGNFSVPNPLLADPAAEVTTFHLPSGVSQVPFRCRWQGRGEDAAMELLGGFLGVTQDPATFALRPLLGWAVRPGTALDQTLMRLADHAPTPPLVVPDFDRTLARLIDHPRCNPIPGDFIAFYKACNGLTLTDRDGTTYRFRPLEAVEVVADPEPAPLPPTPRSRPGRPAPPSFPVATPRPAFATWPTARPSRSIWGRPTRTPPSRRPSRSS